MVSRSRSTRSSAVKDAIARSPFTGNYRPYRSNMATRKRNPRGGRRWLVAHPGPERTRKPSPDPSASGTGGPQLRTPSRQHPWQESTPEAGKLRSPFRLPVSRSGPGVCRKPLCQRASESHVIQALRPAVVRMQKGVEFCIGRFQFRGLGGKSGRWRQDNGQQST